jgi:hypothetical protein
MGLDTAEVCRDNLEIVNIPKMVAQGLVLGVDIAELFVCHSLDILASLEQV